MRRAQVRQQGVVPEQVLYTAVVPEQVLYMGVVPEKVLYTMSFGHKIQALLTLFA